MGPLLREVPEPHNAWVLGAALGVWYVLSIPIVPAPDPNGALRGGRKFNP